MKNSTANRQQSAPSAVPVRHRGVVVYLGNRTGLVRDFDSGKQILFRRDESDVDFRDGAEVEFTVIRDSKNGQRIATNVRPVD